MTTEEILTLVAEMPPPTRAAVARRIATDGSLSDREQRFVARYLVHLDGKRAAAESGWSAGSAVGLLRDPRYANVQRAIAAGQKRVTEDSGLEADYVRKYIQAVLELQPLQYLEVAPDGEVCVNLEEFKKLPAEVQQLVASFETRWVGGRWYTKIEFVDKNKALALAAKYTLTQKIVAAVTQVPWEAIAGVGEEDPVEARIADVG